MDNSQLITGMVCGAVAMAAFNKWQQAGAGPEPHPVVAPIQATAVPPPQAKPTSKVCVVTGGSRGIGAALCVMLGREGYRVCVNYRSQRDKAEQVVADICNAGGKAVAVQADVAIEADVKKLFAEAEAALGPITHLVNNAAVIGPRGPEGSLLEADPATQLQAILDVMKPNVLGAFACCREAAARMSTQKGGSGGAIVNVSSGSAFMGTPMPYGMSKGAMNSMQAGLVPELAEHGIRINSVSPGMTKTDMVSDAVLASNVGKIPMKRGGEPNEIAAVISFLLSDAASYCSGANVRVGGGRPMGGSQ